MKRNICFAAALLGALALPGAAQVEVVLPRPGSELCRIHTQFRWSAFENVASDYELQIVEDDHSFNPFVGGFPLQFHDVPAAEPRTVVDDGLEFGKDYAWRVIAFAGSPPVRAVTPVYRFSTASLPSFIPPIVVTTPAGAAPPEPGLILFGHIGIMSSFMEGLILTVDQAGKVLYFLYIPNIPRVTDLRQLRDGRRDGRLVWNQAPPIQLGTGGRAFETTLDGGVVWASPDIVLPGGGDPFSVHHEVYPMPNGDYLLLVHDNRTLMIGGQPRDYEGDKVVQFARQTNDVVWQWSTFDDYSPRDLHPQIGAQDWTHGNAVVFNPFDLSVYYSARSLSRITRIDYLSGNVLYHLGEQSFTSGDVDIGDNLISFQHAPEPLPNGNLLVYDNGNEREPLIDPRQSRAVELAFDDPVNPTQVTAVWEYRLVDDLGGPLFTAFVGDADRQPGGNTLVTAGRSAIVDEVDDQASLLWRMQVDVGFPTNIIYRSEKIDALVLDTPGDGDGDWDLDMADLANLQVGFSGPGPAGLAFPDRLADHDGDDDLDAQDVAAFATWLTGPAR